MVFLTGIFLTAVTSAQATAETVEARVTELMENMRRSATITPLSLEEMRSDPEAILRALKPFDTDEAPRVRAYANIVCADTAMAVTDKTVRRKSSARLLAAVRDSNASVWQGSLKQLDRFAPGDFDQAARLELLALAKGARRVPAVLRLLGKAPTPDAGDLFRELLSQEGADPVLAWSARLALARQGDRAQVQACLERYEYEPDPIRRCAFLLADLAYTQHPEALAVLRMVLLDDERLPDMDGRPGPACSHYAAQAIQHSFPDAPALRRHIGTYSEQDLARIVAWIDGRQTTEED